MDGDVQQILIIAVGFVIVVVIALLLGRRLKFKRGDTTFETDRGGINQRISATKGGSVKDAKQVNSGAEQANQEITARAGTVEKVEQRTGDQGKKKC